MLLYVDVNDVCGLRCPTCPRGVRAFPNTSTHMSLDMFRKVIEKGKADGAYQVGLFNWVEPFLTKNLWEYARIGKEYQIRCEIASTLSIKSIPGLIECLKYTDMLWVTVSGYSQSIYEINHVSGNIQYVFNNLQLISSALKSGEIKTDILVRFLRFDYNTHEQEFFRELSTSLGFRFEVLIGSGHPIRAKIPEDMQEKTAQAIVLFNSTRIHEPAGTVCPLIFEHIAVNAAGDVYQCSATGNYPSLRIGSYLDLTREEILLRRYSQPYCNSCNWKRRAATEHERSLMHEALDARMGRPVTSRAGPLSGPLLKIEVTAEGYLLPKNGLGPQE